MYKQRLSPRGGGVMTSPMRSDAARSGWNWDWDWDWEGDELLGGRRHLPETDVVLCLTHHYPPEEGERDD